MVLVKLDPEDFLPTEPEPREHNLPMLDPDFDVPKEWLAADMSQLKFTDPQEYNRKPAPRERVERRKQREAEQAAAAIGEEMAAVEPENAVRSPRVSKLVRKSRTTVASSSAAPQSANTQSPDQAMPPTSPTPTTTTTTTPTAPSNACIKVPWRPEVPADITLVEVYKREVDEEQTLPPSKKAKKSADGMWNVEWIGAKGKMKDSSAWWNVKWSNCLVSENTWEPTRNVPAEVLEGLEPLAMVEEEEECDDDGLTMVMSGKRKAP